MIGSLKNAESFFIHIQVLKCECLNLVRSWLVLWARRIAGGGRVEVIDTSNLDTTLIHVFVEK